MGRGQASRWLYIPILWNWQIELTLKVPIKWKMKPKSASSSLRTWVTGSCCSLICLVPPLFYSVPAPSFSTVTHEHAVLASEELYRFHLLCKQTFPQVSWGSVHTVIPTSFRSCPNVNTSDTPFLSKLLKVISCDFFSIFCRNKYFYTAFATRSFGIYWLICIPYIYII